MSSSDPASPIESDPQDSSPSLSLAPLKSYLLNPAPLSSALPLAQFRALFPPAYHVSPQIPVLYRSLEQQRAKDIAHVAANITAEEQRLNALLKRAAVAGSDFQGQVHDDADAGPDADADAETETEAELKEEIRALEGRERELMDRLRVVVGDLSDVRYGRMEREPDGGTVADGAGEALRELRRALEERGGRGQQGSEAG